MKTLSHLSQYGIYLSNNQELVSLFKKRSQFIHNIRSYMNEISAIELEMPCLHKYREGAPVHQFTTIHPLTGERFYLRHCMEDHLKRICNSFNQVYELGKAFRVEKESEFKSNEFTVLEYVGLEVSYEKGIELVINLIQKSITNTFGDIQVANLDFSLMSLIPFDDLMHHVLGFGINDLGFKAKSINRLNEKGVLMSKDADDWEIYEELLKYYLEPGIIAPSIIIDYPIALQHVAEIDASKNVAKRFSVVVNGIEVCDGGVKFSNSSKYRQVYDENAEYRLRVLGISDNDSSEEYYRDIDFYSKNVFTFGFGVDRLFALCNNKSIQEVVMFPLH